MKIRVFYIKKTGVEDKKLRVKHGVPFKFLAEEDCSFIYVKIRKNDEDDTSLFGKTVCPVHHGDSTLAPTYDVSAKATGTYKVVIYEGNPDGSTPLRNGKTTGTIIVS